MKEEEEAPIEWNDTGKRKKKNHSGTRSAGRRPKEEKWKYHMNSDSYRRVALVFYRQKVKGILALSPSLLGVPAKTLGTQSKGLAKIKNGSNFILYGWLDCGDNFKITPTFYL